MSIVFDVNPTQTRLHGNVFLVDLIGCHSLAYQVGTVKDRYQGWMFGLAMNLCEQLAGLTNQVGFDFQAKRQSSFVAFVGDLPSWSTTCVDVPLAWCQLDDRTKSHE